MKQPGFNGKSPAVFFLLRGSGELFWGEDSIRDSAIKDRLWPPKRDVSPSNMTIFSIVDGSEIPNTVLMVLKSIVNI